MIAFAKTDVADTRQTYQTWHETQGIANPHPDHQDVPNNARPAPMKGQHMDDTCLFAGSLPAHCPRIACMRTITSWPFSIYIPSARVMCW